MPSFGLLIPLVVLLSCSADPPVDPDFESASATDANQPTGGPSADGADDESGALPVAVEEHCLFDPVGTLYGFKYQCEGSVAVDVLVEHPFEGSPETGFLELTFGPDEAGDSYADPLVMACCPWYHEHDPYCEQPHERACWIDLVEQGCKSMPSRIEAFAHEHFPGALNAAKRGAILQIADYVGDNQVACVQAFRDTTGLAAMLQECDNEGNSVDFADMLETGSWTFDPPGLVQHVARRDLDTRRSHVGVPSRGRHRSRDLLVGRRERRHGIPGDRPPARGHRAPPRVRQRLTRRPGG